MNKEIFTIENVKKIASQKFGVDYVLDDNNSKIHDILELFGNPTSCKLNPRKGLLLMGGIGTGKTLLMKILSELLFTRDKFIRKKFEIYEIYKPNPCPIECCDESDGIDLETNNDFKYFTPRTFKIISSSALTSCYSREGISCLGYFASDCNYYNYCIDDLGLETNHSKYYGDESNVLAEFLIRQYDIYQNDRFNCLYATTNLDWHNLESYYGNRASSRMKQMFNKIIIDGNDRRH